MAAIFGPSNISFYLPGQQLINRERPLILQSHHRTHSQPNVVVGVSGVDTSLQKVKKYLLLKHF